MPTNLEAKRRVIQQMLKATEKMAAEDLKNRYGQKPSAAAPPAEEK